MGRVLGISGASCSGKGTVARLVASATGAGLFHLDAHWVKGCDKPLVNGEPTFERPHQYDGAALCADVHAFLAAGPDREAVVEGFLLFLYPEALELCDVRVFLAVPDAVVVARRAARSAIRGDHAAGGKAEPVERAWLANGLAEWARFGAGQAALPGVRSVDADAPPTSVARAILELDACR